MAEEINPETGEPYTPIEKNPDLDKYTIFDNFDKLDLSPASLFIDPSTFDLLDSPSSAINNINYGSFNETIYKEDNFKNHPRPISFSSNMELLGGYLPDMFNFINNIRFFIDLNGNARHTSNLSLYNPNSVDNYPFIEYSLVVNNIFKQQFFFDIYLGNLSRHLSLGMLLYKNKFFTPGTEENYTNVLNNYLADGDDEILAPLQQMNNLWNDSAVGEAVFLNGNNRIIFDYVKDTQSLNTFDLFTPGTNLPITQLDYLDDYAEPGGHIPAIGLLLQRLLYPIGIFSTLPDAMKPKHIYVVTDLKKSSPYSDSLVTIISKYNYYKEGVETPPDNVQLEWQLPNIYAYYKFSTTSNNVDINNYFTKIVKLDSDPPLLDNFTFDEYYNISNNSLPSTENIERHKRIIFGSNVRTLLGDVISLDEITKTSQLIPYYIKITLPPEYSGEEGIISKIVNLYGARGLNIFMSIIGNYFSSGGFFDSAIDFSDIPNFKSLHTFSLVNRTGLSDAESGVKTKASMSTLQILDLSTITDQDFGHYALDFESTNIKLADDSPSIPQIVIDNQETFLGDINSIKSFLISAANSHLQTTEAGGYNRGEKCYSEVVALEVAKYKIINGEKIHLQSFFVPCLDDNQKEIIDTQVFYDQEYIYEVFSISLVFGYDYESSLAATADERQSRDLITTSRRFPDDEGASQAEEDKNIDGFKFELAEADKKGRSSKPVLIRAPYYNNLSILNSAKIPDEQEKITVLDNPPLPPDISFQPYKDVNNKVLITLNINYGEEKLKAIRVFPEDEEKIIKIQQNQKHLNLKPNEVLYKTDDFKGTYKIYRTTKEPISWESFSGADLKEIQNEQTAGYNDDILPNVDYYYFARFEDMHNNLSNPTSVFYVRIVQDGDFPPFMIVKVHKFSDARPPFAYDKTMKKFLKIRLADGVRQYYNLNNLETVDMFYEKPLSGGGDTMDNKNGILISGLKKYKVRITSKKTGKKIDINIGFNKKISDQYLNTNLLVEGED